MKTRLQNYITGSPTWLRRPQINSVIFSGICFHKHHSVLYPSCHCLVLSQLAPRYQLHLISDKQYFIHNAIPERKPRNQQEIEKQQMCVHAAALNLSESQHSLLGRTCSRHIHIFPPLNKIQTAHRAFRSAPTIIHNIPL